MGTAIAADVITGRSIRLPTAPAPAEALLLSQPNPRKLSELRFGSERFSYAPFPATFHEKNRSHHPALQT